MVCMSCVEGCRWCVCHVWRGVGGYVMCGEV